MSNLDPMAERAAATILVEATDPAAAAADPRVAEFLQSCSELLGREAASIMDLRWRDGLDAEEISTRLSIPVEWVNDQLAMLPALFGNMVRSRLLWFGGQPHHDELGAQLAGAGATAFDAMTSRTILAHARNCETCDDLTSMRIEPIVAFGETPPPAPVPEAPRAPSVAPSVEPATGSSSAAARIAAATAAGSAAAAASAAASTPRVDATPPPPTVGPRHAPVGRTTDDEGGNKKKVIIAAVAGGVLAVLLVGFLLTRSGGSDQADVATGGASPTTVEKKVYQSTSTTAPTTTTTRPPTTTTTEAPPVPDSLMANVNGGPTANVPQGFPTSSATINWITVVAPVLNVDTGGDGASMQPERWVEVSGPGISRGRHPETGSLAVCPSAEPDLCNVVPGSYDYTVTLFVNGADMASQTVTLIVDPPPAQPGP